MGSSSDLSLGFKTRQPALADTHQQLEHMKNLERCLKALEEEQTKIEAFKRELPLCMQLLKDAIEGSKQNLAEYRSGSGTLGSNFAGNNSNHQIMGKFEQFIPLESDHGKPVAQKDGETLVAKSSERRIDKDNDSGDITQAEKWRLNSKSDGFGQEKLMPQKKQQEELGRLCIIEASTALFPNSSLSPYPSRRSCGAFSPFVKAKQSVSVPSETEIQLGFSSQLSHEDCQRVSSSFMKYEDVDVDDAAMALGRAGGHDCPAAGSIPILENSSDRRKARRCWSPELHRRFVNALKQLGGPQVATPKQIRELMRVDGLTNDEVKSHLQKYRLHTRRSSPATQPTAAQSPQLVVLGGIWMSSEYAAPTQSPGMYDSQASEKQSSQCSPPTTHSFPYLTPICQMQLQQTSFSEQLQQSHSNSSTAPQWQRQVSLPAQGSSEEQEKESNGDDVQSDNTSRRGGNLKGSGRDLNACEQHVEDDDGDFTQA